MNKRKVPKIRFKGFYDDWEQRKLEDLCELITKQTGFDYSASIKPSLVTERQDDTYPFIQNKDFNGNDINVNTDFYIPVDVAEGFPKILLDKPSVLISISGRIGNVGFYRLPEKAFIGGAVGICKLKNPDDGEFIIQELESDYGQKYFQSLIKASSHANITVEDIRNIELVFPQNEEERKPISAFLNSLDHLITLHQRKLEKLKIIKKSMLENCFPKNGEKAPPIRFSGFSDDWEQRKLADIVDRITRKNENLESTLPLTISAQYGLIDQNEFFDKRIASKDVSGYYLVRRGEFAYNKSTSSDAPWGAIKRLDRYACGVLSTLYIVFRILDEDKVNSDYLVTYYDTDLWHKGVQAIAAEGARNHGLLNIAPADFFETKVAVPKDIEEQRMIGAYFMRLDHLITLHQSKLEKLKMIKKSMLETMFV